MGVPRKGVGKKVCLFIGFISAGISNVMNIFLKRILKVKKSLEYSNVEISILFMFRVFFQFVIAVKGSRRKMLETNTLTNIQVPEVGQNVMFIVNKNTNNRYFRFLLIVTKPALVAVLPDRGWNLPPPYLPVWSHKTKIQWLPLSVTSLLRVKPKMYEDERFDLVISRCPHLARLFEGLRWFLLISVYRTWQVDRNFEILKCLEAACRPKVIY